MWPDRPLRAIFLTLELAQPFRGLNNGGKAQGFQLRRNTP